MRLRARTMSTKPLARTNGPMLRSPSQHARRTLCSRPRKARRRDHDGECVPRTRTRHGGGNTATPRAGARPIVVTTRTAVGNTARTRISRLRCVGGVRLSVCASASSSSVRMRLRRPTEESSLNSPPIVAPSRMLPPPPRSRRLSIRRGVRGVLSAMSLPCPQAHVLWILHLIRACLGAATDLLRALSRVPSILVASSRRRRASASSMM